MVDLTEQAQEKGRKGSGWAAGGGAFWGSGPAPAIRSLAVTLTPAMQNGCKDCEEKKEVKSLML